MKYELTEETKVVLGVTFSRVRAFKNFSDVKKGDLGGWVEGEKNLSQLGNARVSGNAEVSGNARVYGNARVSGNAWVCGKGGMFSITNVGSENGTLTAYKTKTGIGVNRGCFSGTLEEFKNAVNETHGDSKIAEEYRLLIKFIELKLK